MIAAIVIIKTATRQLVFDAIGCSVNDISESAEALAGDEPFGMTVLVTQ